MDALKLGFDILKTELVKLGYLPIVYLALL